MMAINQGPGRHNALQCLLQNNLSGGDPRPASPHPLPPLHLRPPLPARPHRPLNPGMEGPSRKKLECFWCVETQQKVPVTNIKRNQGSRKLTSICPIVK